MGNRVPRTSVDVVTARALRVALDRSRAPEDATAALLPACGGSRHAAAGALDRLERAYRAQPDDVLARAIVALQGAVAALPEAPPALRSSLHLVAPSA